MSANILMIVMLLAGAFALTKINRQFFPTFNLETISVRTTWPGANAEDVERSITQPIEEALRTTNYIEKMTSSSSGGSSAVTLEFKEGTDMTVALEQVNQRIDGIRNLPQGAEETKVNKVVRYEPVGRILLSSAKLSLFELRKIAFQIERELVLKKGIDNVDFNGLPPFQIVIRFNESALRRIGMSLQEVGQAIKNASLDIPVGTLGDKDSERVLRITAQGREVGDFADIVVRAAAGELVRLSDIATISLDPEEGSPLFYTGGDRAIELVVERVEGGDTLKAANALLQWEKSQKGVGVDGVDVKLFDRNWEALDQRIGILLSNGLGGLLIVIFTLYLFMNARVAFWVAMGIPASLMLTLFILYLLGGSINMISVFGLLLSLGIIVDDAIIVGEHALKNYEDGKPPLEAAIAGAHRMVVPVLASSLTTVAAFLPLLLVGGTIGKIMVALPIVTICVILASLLESFWVLPGHLHHGLVAENRKEGKRKPLNAFLTRRFEHFCNNGLMRFTRWVLCHRSIVLAVSVSTLIAAAGLISSGVVKFEFFPTPEGRKIYMQVSFVPGTPSTKVREYLVEANHALREALHDLGDSEESIVKVIIQRQGRAYKGARGENVGSIFIELADPDQRTIRNQQLVDAWRERLPQWAGIERIGVFVSRAGPPGSDLSIRMGGASALQVKHAGADLEALLQQLPGVQNIQDDLPWGKDQIVFELTDEAIAQNVSLAYISAQLRSAFASLLVQVYHDGDEEIEVRLKLDQTEVDSLATLDNFDIKLPAGGYAPLANLVIQKSRQGFDTVRRYDGRAALEISADLDEEKATFNELERAVRDDIMPQIVSRHGVDWKFSGRAEDQQATLKDMKIGGALGLVMIYVILAWVFSSWGWPLLIMFIIPFGLIGATFGHYLLGLNLTVLSLLGLFGLSGIIINDSIVLVTTYRSLKEGGMYYVDALVEAVKQRFRAVLLTSLTTIGGLIPLLFETSLQAQFLIPMAATLVFGLATGTLLILFVVPAELSLYEQSSLWLRQFLQPGRDEEKTCAR